MCKKTVLGFTLIEVILVIIVLGIMATATTSYLGLGARMYAESADRDKLLSQSRFAIERLTRELRNIVPNSVRTWNNGQCIEFAPLLQAGRYEGSLTSPSPTVLFSAVGWDGLMGEAVVFMTVYPVNAATDIYQQQRVASALTLDVDDIDPRLLEVTFGFTGTIPNSPSQRMYFMSAPIAYCVVGNALFRYKRNSIEAVEGVNLPAPVLMAEGIDASFYTVPDSDVPAFSFENSVVLTRNSVVHIRLAFQSGFNDALVFNQEIHIPNVP
jgi:MSHA biogenesis protein MshO